jgi:hypothetical protein
VPFIKTEKRAALKSELFASDEVPDPADTDIAKCDIASGYHI